MGTLLFRLLRRSCSKCFSSAIESTPVYVRNLAHRGRLYSLFLAAQILTPAENKDKLKPPDPAILTHNHLIRNACGSSLDAVSALFFQTVSALMDAEQGYAKAIHMLITLLDYSLSVLSYEEKQNKVWELIIQQRTVVKEAKERKQELEILKTTVEDVMNGLAQAAFLAGSDFASISASERVLSAQSHIDRCRQESEEAELELTEMDIKIIKVTSQHQEEQKQELESVDNPTDIESVKNASDETL